MEKSERIASVGKANDNPPNVHPKDEVYGFEPPGGVWRTEVDCYELMAELCEPGTATLETGLGISTVLFATWGCEHTCVVPSELEHQKLKDYFVRNGIDDGAVRFEIGHSEQVLPGLKQTPLDLVFIDGGHGFPTAIIDWFYAAGRLRTGGVLILDDLMLPTVTLGLLDFLDGDPRWTALERTDKWAAWRRESEGPLSEEWLAQPFIAPVEMVLGLTTEKS